MDEEWTIGQAEAFAEDLTWWLKQPMNVKQHDRAVGMLPVLTRIIQDVGPTVPDQDYIGNASGPAWRGRALQAIHLLRNRTEIEGKLGRSGPKPAAADLHPNVWSAAAALWDDGHFGAAVQRAAIFVNAEVQSRAHRPGLSDTDLMNQVFSDTEPRSGQPRLRWPGDPDDRTVRSMNSGIRSFAAGVFQAIRNPATHDTAEVPSQVGLDNEPVSACSPDGSTNAFW
jgi:hypothetical protein